MKVADDDQTLGTCTNADTGKVQFAPNTTQIGISKVRVCDLFRSAPGDGRNVGLRPQGCRRLHAASTEATEAQAAARGQVVSLFALVRFREKLPSSFRR